ncbi:MAG: zinc-ribbon domain-containing protein [Clostridium sp.]|jgi:elongation factor Tu|nr:zinc-ribbon domain-containing protein [Clostridium sp.]
MKICSKCARENSDSAAFCGGCGARIEVSASGYESTEKMKLTVEDVFTITGRGTVVVGKLSSGHINTGDSVVICKSNGENLFSVVTGIEMFRKLINTASVGDNVGLLLRGIQRAQVERGDIIVSAD